MKRKQLISLARKLGVSEQYYTSPTKRLIWAIQEAEGSEACSSDDERNSQGNKWNYKK